MELVKITFEKLRKFNQTARMFLLINPDNEKTKLGYAIKRTQESSGFIKITKDYNRDLDNKRIDLCLTDRETGAVLSETTPNAIRPYKYDKEGTKKIAIAEEKLLEDWDKKEFEIDVYFTTEVPKDLHEEFYKMFLGIVIKEENNESKES